MTTRNARPEKGAWKDLYLEKLQECGSLTAAARDVGVDPKTAYRQRAVDADFNAAVEELRHVTVERVEDTLYEMASSGKDTTATIFFLKSRKPEVYGDRLRADQLEQVRQEARQQLLDELRAEMGVLTPAARRALMAAIPGAA